MSTFRCTSIASCFVLIFTISTAVRADPYYRINVNDPQQPLDFGGTQTSSSPGISIDDSFDLVSEVFPSHIDRGNGFARADQGIVGAAVDAERNFTRGTPRAVGASAEFEIDDLMFSSDGESPIDVVLQLQLTGSLFPLTPATGSARVRVDVGLAGQDLAGTLTNGSPANGLLAGLAPGPVDTVIFASFTNVPINTPTTLSIELGTAVFVDGNSYAASLFGSTLSFVEDGPVFVVPDGATVDSEQGGIVNNRFGATPNTPPVAVASILVDGEDQGSSVVLPCENGDGVIVALDGSGSSDPDGDDLEGEWAVAEDSGILIFDPTAAVTDAIFPIGVHEVILTVYDLDSEGVRKGTLDVTTVTVTVFDETPPLVRVTTDFAALWPPNHKMVPVLICVETSDACADPDSLVAECFITSSQPDDSHGSGRHVGDVDGSDGFLGEVPIVLVYLGDGVFTALVELRAERDGRDKAGRIYSISLGVQDAAGNVGQASTTVVVPHNHRRQ